MPSRPIQHVYRVLGFPSDWQEGWIKSAFIAIWERNGEPYTKDTLEILDIVPWLSNDEYSVVFVRFDEAVPAFLKKCRYHSLNEIDVQFDDEFLGCTQLYQPQGPIVAE